MFTVDIQVLLPDGSRLALSKASEIRKYAVRNALDAVPLGGVAVSAIVTSTDGRPGMDY